MTGLTRIPQVKDLVRAYARLQTSKRGLRPQDIVLWSQWSRFDPRLAEQLVEHLRKHWQTIDPIRLNKLIGTMVWPAALGMILEQTATFTSIAKTHPHLFLAWARLVMTDISPANGELFFIGLRGFGGKSSFEDALYSIGAYRKWGYLGRDILVNKARPTGRTLVKTEGRSSALSELMATRKRITVNDYMCFLGERVSRRQAELDLSKEPRLKPRGRTRGRFYVVR